MTKPRKNAKPIVSRQDAKHEAAHAVVSVRLGLPLELTSVQSARPVAGATPPPVAQAKSVGHTTLAEGAIEGWVSSLPDPAAVERLEGFAAQGAAGIVAEIQRGADIYDMAHRDDLQRIVQIAGLLGIGEGTDEPAVREFVGAAIGRAGNCLMVEDDGVAWEAVTAALFRKKKLTGVEVQTIVAACG